MVRSSTRYHAAAIGKDDVGQQPNIELSISDLPRPRPKPDPARGWSPNRPGELGGPEDHKWGAGYGATGPDAGYALSLAAGRDIELAEGEHRANANLAVAAIASARSSLFGRGPTKKDVDLALVVLGFDAEGVPTQTAAALASNRLEWFAAASHNPDKLTTFVACLFTAVLRLTAAEARGRMAQGDALINC